MTREESWQVEGLTLTLLRHVTSLGYTVSVFRFPASLLGTWPGCVEMHALDLSQDPPTKHVARVVEGRRGIWTIGARACWRSWWEWSYPMVDSAC